MLLRSTIEDGNPFPHFRKGGPRGDLKWTVNQSNPSQSPFIQRERFGEWNY